MTPAQPARRGISVILNKSVKPARAVLKLAIHLVLQWRYALRIKSSNSPRRVADAKMRRLPCPQRNKRHVFERGDEATHCL